MVSALLFPVHIFLIGLAFPLGWLDAPDYESLRSLVIHPITRLLLFLVLFFPLFHSANRFRYTIYDLFQVKHGAQQPIALLCYGTALLGSVLAAYTLLTIA